MAASLYNEAASAGLPSSRAFAARLQVSLHISPSSHRAQSLLGLGRLGGSLSCTTLCIDTSIAPLLSFVKLNLVRAVIPTTFEVMPHVQLLFVCSYYSR